MKARTSRNDDLASLLTLRAPLFAEEAHRRWLLGLAPFRPPREHPLHATAVRLVARATVEPGAALLAGEHRGRGALFWMATGEPPARLIPFRGEAREQVELARRIVPRALPALVDPAGLDAVFLGARRAVLGATDPGALDGPSFGLAICLALASRLLDEPTPSDLVALARVDEEGRCRSVGHLEAKLDVVARWALGVRRVLVTREQQEEAEGIARALGAPLTIVAVESLAEGLAVAFGDVEGRLRARWVAAPERARVAAKALLSLARDGYSGLLDWRAVARAAQGLAAQLPEGEHRWMAELAMHIADRHRRAPRALSLRPDWLARQPRPFRLKLWAHLVQSAADGVDEWRALVRSAEAEIADVSQQHAEDLELAGAIGRARAAWYEHREAIPWLERAAAGWMALERAHDASYATCELLRVGGALGDRALVERALARFARPVLDDARTTHASKAFVQVAIGRAQVLLGDARQALVALDEGAARWALAPAHGRAARARWRAEALSELGQESAAQALRKRLTEEDAEEEASAVVLLARLDRAARQGEHDALLGELEGHPLLGPELTRLVARFRPTLTVETIALLRRHSRY